jgi:hypothetical protein
LITVLQYVKLLSEISKLNVENILLIYSEKSIASVQNKIEFYGSDEIVVRTPSSTPNIPAVLIIPGPKLPVNSCSP